MLAKMRGLARAGGINGLLIADKPGRWNAEQGAVRRESPAKATDLSWKAARRARSGPLPPPRAGHDRQTGAEVDAGAATGL